MTSNEQSGRPPAMSSWIPSPGLPQIILVDDGDVPVQADPGTVVLTCANCGAMMDERNCKLICRCGYFLSCSDYY